MRPSFIASCFVSLMFAASSHGAIVIVDAAGGPGVFTSFKAAIVAAADGDTVLVHPGNYVDLNDLPFVPEIKGKSLSVIASPAGAAVQLGTVVVSNLTASQVVVIRGVDMSGQYQVAGTFNLPGLVVANCAGSIVVEDATIVGGNSGPGPHIPLPGWPGVSVHSEVETLDQRDSGILLGGRRECRKQKFRSACH